MNTEQIYHSPNYNARPADADITFLIFHYTGMQSSEEALKRLCDPIAEVSAHYLIDEKGTCYNLVPEEERAWHAGVSYWAGNTDINSSSIGIELVNPGHEFGYRPFPSVQMEALASLSQTLLKKYPIPAKHVLGHSDIAPSRKQDPGELFDWRWCAEQDIGVWVEPEEKAPLLEIRQIQDSLQRYGYECPVSGVLDPETQQVITAFQRHFCPALLSGQPDQETKDCLWALEKYFEKL